MAVNTKWDRLFFDIEERTEKYKETVKKNNRKNKGQFFTTLSVVKRMAGHIMVSGDHIKILDPGAGNGLLGAAAVYEAVRSDVSNISLTFIEKDPDVLGVLNGTIVALQDACRKCNVALDVHLIRENFLLWDTDDVFDVIICNPPYKKIRKDTEESVALSQFVYGQPNLYGLFMAKSLSLLSDNGDYIFITPRSWTSGKYFLKVREAMFASVNIQAIDLFCSRDDVFKNEDVLQETMILYGKLGVQQDNIILSRLSDNSIQNVHSFPVAAKTIRAIGDESYLLLPSDEDDVLIIQEMAAISGTFSSMGYRFKTGPVVEFRNTKNIHTEYQDGDIPMFRSLNIVNGRFVFPAATDKPQYICPEDKSLLVPNKNTILIRRLSTKEEPVRIQACRYYPATLDPFISIENHVNYLVREDGREMSKQEIDHLYGLLTSKVYDRYFRLLNGSTQVNAGELNKLPCY